MCVELRLTRARTAVYAILVGLLFSTWAEAGQKSPQPTPDEVQSWIKKLQDKDDSVRLQAAKTLGKLGPAAKDAIPFLKLAAEKDQDPDVRQVAAMALGRIQTTTVSDAQVTKLIEELSDKDEAVRLKAAKSLGRFGASAKAALTALQDRAKNDPDEDVRRVSAQAVAAISQGGGVARSLVGTFKAEFLFQGIKHETSTTFTAEGDFVTKISLKKGDFETITGVYTYKDGVLTTVALGGYTDKGTVTWLDDNRYAYTITATRAEAFIGARLIYSRVK